MSLLDFSKSNVVYNTRRGKCYGVMKKTLTLKQVKPSSFTED